MSIERKKKSCQDQRNRHAALQAWGFIELPYPVAAGPGANVFGGAGVAPASWETVANDATDPGLEPYTTEAGMLGLPANGIISGVGAVLGSKLGARVGATVALSGFTLL